MPNGNDTKDKNAQGQKPGPANDGTRRWIPSSRYEPCSDPNSRTSVHSVEANRQIADSRNGYAERKAQSSKGNSR